MQTLRREKLDVRTTNDKSLITVEDKLEIYDWLKLPHRTFFMAYENLFTEFIVKSDFMFNN